MLKALLLMLVAMSCIPAGDAASKILTSQMGVAPVFVVWTRFAIGALIVLPFTWRGGLSVWRDWRVWFRSCLIALGISCITRALSTAPLADVFGAFFIGPMVSFVLSVWLLKERAHWVQAAMVLIGFAGVLLIVRPGFNLSAGLGWAAIAGCCYGSFLTASRWLAPQVSMGGLMLTQLLGPVFLTTPFVIGNVPQMDWTVLALVTVSSVFSMLGNLLTLVAYKMQDASKLAPFIYFQLFSAVTLGWFVFGDWPDALTVLGMALIVGAGVSVALWHSRRPLARLA